MRFLLWSVTVFLSIGMSQAQVVQSIQGQVEVQSDRWQPLVAQTPFERPIRALLGRADLKFSEGRFLLGSNSSAQPRNREVQLLSGQGYAEGSFTFYLGSTHVFVQGKARVDLTGNSPRISVLQGLARISSPGRGLFYVPEGKTYNLNTQALKDFIEDDAWYNNELLGPGNVKVAALKGAVEVQKDQLWQKLRVNSVLQLDDVIRTGKSSWAEFTFEDDTYFRLNENSKVRVLSIEKLSAGKRRVVLKLEQGTAWNVVQKGNGGYQFRTATLVAGVRGTVFRIDADDTIKVFEGTVTAGDENSSIPIQRNEQFTPAQGTRALNVDPLDAFNQSMDLLHSKPVTIDLDPLPVGSLQQLTLSGRTLPGSNLQFEEGKDILPIEVADDGSFQFTLELPDGPHLFTLRAQRAGREFTLTGEVVIEHKPPVQIQPLPEPPVVETPAAVQLQPAAPLEVQPEVVPLPAAPTPVPLFIELQPLGQKPMKQVVLAGRVLPGSALRYEEGERVVPLELQEDGRFQVPLPLADGLHTFTLRSTLQNSEFSLSQTVLVDQTPPEIRFLKARREGRWLLLEVSVQDATAVTLNVLGKDFGLDGATLRLPLSEQDAALQTLSLRLIDEAGNTTTRDVPVE
ncbi:FecR family protein [Deinococcus cellulosilyticus]|uniref:FecR protein domain-containing protein n=1 Tax=Deinococcus cellulosilyticus (strain DSM 18568 / NBRC 106333 / KACC 11606 / 5516J-15) TaxID=1223518 RepID=A0A511N0F0_DEIC1|nr:FecR family protein [Deinococcus cellulosilyticus]GEM45948.1 hypothetical protein DC3_15830 [Deinococcus cellulosilyticus NBRC 106333 = KACC 11606]